MMKLRALQPDEPLFATMLTCLDAAALPTADLLEGDARYFALGADGFGGFVRLGELAQLRSIVVRQSARNRGTGAEILIQLIEKLRELRVTEAWLLTTTARAFFEQHGFVRADRSETPSVVAETPQFRTLCPDTAIVMRRGLV